MKRLVQLLVALIFASLFLFGANNALSFDGTDDYVLVADNASLDLNSSMTLEFWLKLSGTTGKEVLSKTNADDDENFRIYIDPSLDQIYFDYGNKYAQTHDFSLSTNIWYHMAFTVVAGEVGHIFVNGVEAETYSTQEICTTPIPTNDHAMEIGGATVPLIDRHHNGEVDELRIWNDIRTENEIRQNMYRELPDPSLESNLVAYYKFNETSGTTLDDAKGSNNGTLTNMSGNEWQTSPAMFGPRNCLNFDGGNKTGSPDYAYKNSNVTSNTDNFTMMAWIKADDVSNGSNGWRCIAYNGSDAGGYGIGIADTKVASLFGGISWNISNEVLVADTWYHIALRRTSGTSEYFLNGKKLDYTTTSTPKAVSSKFSIGNMYQGDNSTIYTDSFDGKIEDVMVFDAALSDVQIRTYMCKSLNGNETNLVAYYNFDNSSGSILQSFDGSVTNDLTMINMSDNDWVESSAYNTWLNTSSSDWSTLTNWSRESKPVQEAVGIYSYSGGLTPSFDIGDEAGAGLMYIDMNSDWSIGGYLSIVGDLFLESNIDLNGQTIELGSNSTLYEGSGHIYGTSGSITTTRTLNNISSENVGGLGAVITCSANMGSTVISRSHQVNGDPLSIKRRYTINPTTNTGLNATLVFPYNDNEINGLSESYLDLYRSTDGGTNWGEMNASVNTFVNTITLENIDAFSLWTAMESESETPPVLETQNPSQEYTSGTSAIVVAPLTTITTATDIENATISISPIISDDILSVSALPAGLTSSWDNNTKILSISGTSSAADYQTALRNVKFESTTSADDTRTIDFILGDGVGLSIDGKQHFYEVIDNGGSISWSTARAVALDSRFGEAQGYLATITSEEENDYLAEKVVSDTWIGASDLATEGVWTWADGPETGTQFWQGDLNAGNAATTNYGSVVPGGYANWGGNEPNNNYLTHGEDCAHMYGSASGGNAGYWNDYYESYANVQYYIIEYGGDGATFTTIDDAQVSVSVAPSLSTSAAASITASSAVLGGNVTSNGGDAVFERGVVYSSTNSEPEIEEEGVSSNANGSGTGSFSESISGLVSNTTYYVQAYAVNNAGTTYGGVQTFTTQEGASAIELISFEAIANDYGIKLAWETACETENQGYILERKNDYDTWEIIASYLYEELLIGQGTTSESHVYSWLDENVVVGVEYQYRLTDVEFDGRLTQHQAITVNAASGLSAAYPNPFNPSLTVEFGLSKGQHVRLNIYDLQGRQIEALIDAEFSKGTHQYQWHPINLCSGVYFIHMQSEDASSFEKVMYMK